MPQESRRTLPRDPNATGVTFIDLLFALTVGKYLDTAAAGHLMALGWVQWVAGAMLTLTSWVGYHNSLNRSRHFLRFWNLPLGMFIVDVLLVVDYWFIPAFAVARDARASTMVTAGAVAIAGVGYVVWDRLALAVRRSPLYTDRPITHDVDVRRRVSVGFLCAAALVFFVSAVVGYSTQVPAYAIAVTLTAVTILYRDLKDRLTPPSAREFKSPDAPEGDLDVVPGRPT